MRKNVLLTVAVLSGLATAAQAQFSTTGPFTGSLREGFENVPGFSCPPCSFACLKIFGGAADVCDASGANGLTIVPNWNMQCSITPHTGSMLFGSGEGAVTIEFNVGLKRFGGWFGDIFGQGLAKIEFFDAEGLEIGPPLEFELDGCNWTWHGWDANGPAIHKVKIFGANSGAFVMMDDLEADGVGGGCYADCDSNGQLTVRDFACFQNQFVSATSYADCNQSGTLTVADFACFQNQFVIGCP